MHNFTLFVAGALGLMPALVLAGNAAPAPVAGAFGPVGLAVAGVGYVAYKFYKRGK